MGAGGRSFFLYLQCLGVQFQNIALYFVKLGWSVTISSAFKRVTKNYDLHEPYELITFWNFRKQGREEENIKTLQHNVSHCSSLDGMILLLK